MQRFVGLVLCTIILASIVIAGVELQSENLVKDYAGGDVVSGTINLTLEDISVDALVSSNFEGDITLKDLLEANNYSEGSGFTCSRTGCIPGFQEGEIANSFELSVDESLIGFKVQGNPFAEMIDLKFRVRSDKSSSCTSPVKIDVLGDGLDLISGSNYLDTQCFSTKHGCFEDYLENSEYQETQIPVFPNKFCEKMTLPEGPAFKLGARVINSTSGNARLNMSLIDMEGYPLGSCTLPRHSSSIQDLECVVEFSSAVDRDYYACISASDTSDYKIRVEFVEPCGTNNPGSGSNSIDYEIFAKNLMYGSTDISIDPQKYSSLTNENLLNDIEEYIQETYGNSCNPKCIVPIELIGADQVLTISEVSVKYQASGSGTLENNNLYEVSMTPSTLSTDELELDIEKAGFVIPRGSEADYLELMIDDESLINVGINISGGFGFDISPKFVPFGKKATFNVITFRNVTNVRWNFGDGSIKTSTSKTLDYTYTEQGEFNVSVTITDVNRQTATSVFKVIVGNARESANVTLEDYKKEIQLTKDSLNAYPLWIQTEIKTLIQLDSLDTNVKNLDSRFKNSTTDEQFEDIMLDLMELDVPSGVNSSVRGTVPIEIGLNSLNVEYIAALSNANVTGADARDSLKNDIITWMSSNVAATINFEEVFAKYDSGNEPVLTKFHMQITPKGSLSNTFLIIDFPRDQITFTRDYGQEEILGATNIPASGLSNLEFAISGSVRPDDLAAYVSPFTSTFGGYEPISSCDFDRVCEETRGENRDNCPTDCRPYGTAVFIIVIIVLGGIIVFVLMRLWYKRHYENKLFPKRVDLFNITNFVRHAKENGLNSLKIRSHLKKAGWKGEQISYAFKKVKW